MKWICLIFTFLILSCAHTQRSPGSSDLKKHVVFDIDWTLVAEIKNPSERVKQLPRVIEVEGHYYYLHDGAEEFIESILAKKDVGISFYSGGSHQRNIQLLSKIKTKTKESFKDIAYKTLGREDLVTIADADPSWPFAKRYKKDLSKIFPILDDLIMFDDTANFVWEADYPQSNHVFFIGTSFEFFETFEDARLHSGKFVPKDFDEWLLDRSRLLILREAFENAYKTSLDSAISLSEAMKKEEDLLQLSTNKWNEKSKSYYAKAMKRLQKKSLLDASDCQKNVGLILGLEF